MQVKNISIVIPSYKGKELLKKCLPSVFVGCKHYSLGKTEIIIVDDASRDETVDYLESHFPDVKIIEHPVNKGFSVSANHGIFAAKNRIVVLLNNDVKISKDFLNFLPPHFEDVTVFAVRPFIKSGIENGGNDLNNQRTGGEFRLGFIYAPVIKQGKQDIAFFAGGGASAFDKEKFLQLGGFDEMYSPFYFEDVDLSYRAWKRGWKTVYEPESSVYHQGGATINKFYAPQRINLIVERNRYFLVWKNITDKKLLIQHFVFIPIRIVAFLVRGKFTPLSGFLSALRQVKTVVKKRKYQKQVAQLKDSEIFGHFKK